MTPNARRIMTTAQQHRRQRATARWFVHHAELSEYQAHAALTELKREGLVAQRDDGLYVITNENESP